MIGQACYSWRCPCGALCSVTFDLVARRHDVTHQCRDCDRAVRVQRPIMLEVVPSKLAVIPEAPAISPPATRDFQKGDPA